jgi:hypothetical protein
MIYENFLGSLSTLLGHRATQTFENRTFNAVMIFISTTAAILFSYDFFLGNIASQCIDILCIIYSISCYIFSIKYGTHKKLATATFVFLYIVISIGWFFNNGINGSIPYFFFILSCYAGVFFEKPLKNAIPVIIATVLTFTILEFTNPELISIYTSKIYNFIDVTVSIITCLIINGISIHIIYKKYNTERNINLKMLNQAIADKELIEKSMNEIQVLRGFLPICSHCKKIRDDQGEWKQLEKYIQDNSEAKFSHSMCPECALTMYPQYFDKNNSAAHPISINPTVKSGRLH